MHLVSPLASGLVGAENGWARIYRRGTSTRATIYTDFEASTADSSGDDIDLDSAGAVVVYVNELVLVQVYSSLGQLVREFVAGEGAYAVEVISAAFTGTDYSTGQRAVSKPTNVGAVLDLWLTSAGAADWKVLFSGAATDLQDALGSIYGLFFNVKSPEFGALGNGTADDTASWQAAHDAAFAAGGGVVVAPPGTYNISSAIAWKAGVHLFCMPDSVTLRQVTAATVHIAIGVGLASPTKTPTYLIGCAFDSTVTNAATQVTVAHGTEETVILQGCRFNISDFCTGAGVVIASSLGTTIVRDSVLTARANVRLIYDTSTANDGVRLFVDGCWLKSLSGGAYGTEIIKSVDNELRVTNTRFLLQGTSGNTVCVALGNSNYSLIVSGCNFKDSAGGAVPYAVGLYVGGRYQVENNYLGPGVYAYYQAAVTDVTSEGLSNLEMRAEGTGTTTGVTHTVNDLVESYFLRSTNVAATQVTLPKGYFYGQVLRLAIKNNSGSNWAATSPTLIAPAGMVVAYDSTSPNLNNGRFATVTLVLMNVASTICWVQIGPWGNVA